MNRFDAVSPFDARYYGANPDFFARTKPFLSEEAQILYQIRVEKALLLAFVDLGVLPAKAIEGKIDLLDSIPPAEVYEEEEITQHNVRALVNCIQRRLDDEAAAYVHLTATSCDITDTARALSFKEYTESVLIPDSIALVRELAVLARRHAGRVQMGRTHGQHAIPTTFGNAVALYVSRLGKRVEFLAQASRALQGKVAGAVGVYSAQSLVIPSDPASLEKAVMKRLGLRAPETNMASQIVEPEYVTDLGYGATSLFSILANLADDFRHLMRTEIGELGKKTQAGHVGVSTMPHKVNPKDFENVKSLWKAYMPRIVTLLSDQISEHQRDLTNSASGRYLQELLAACAYAVMRTRKALAQVTVQEGRMQENLDLSKDQFIAEPLYIVLSYHGIPNGYDIVRKASRKAREKGSSVSALLKSDPDLTDVLAQLPDQARKTIETILATPESYTGLAEEATHLTCDTWEKKLADLEKTLPN